MNCFNSKLMRFKSNSGDYHYVTVRCGRCAACISSKAFKNSADLINESVYYNYGLDASFITLTYSRRDTEQYKCGLVSDPLSGKYSLDYQHIVDFKKRLRRRVDYHLNGLKLKFFGSSEYGLKTNNNPHYHFIIFGLNSRNASHVAYIKSCWLYGHVDVKSVTDKSIRYVTSYMSKSRDFKTGYVSKEYREDYELYKVTAAFELFLFDRLNSSSPRYVNFSECLIDSSVMYSLYHGTYNGDYQLRSLYNKFVRESHLFVNLKFRFYYKDYLAYVSGRVTEFHSKSPGLGKRWLLDNFDLLLQSDHIFNRREKRYLLNYNPDLLDVIEEHNEKYILQFSKASFESYLNFYNIDYSDLIPHDDVIFSNPQDKYNVYLYSNFDDILRQESEDFFNSFKENHTVYIQRLLSKRNIIPEVA